MPRRNGQPVGTTPDTRRWWTLAAMALAVLAIGLDLTILSTALPTLARDLHASTTDLQWFANSYTLVLAALMLPAGAVSDRVGPKPLMIGALVVFGAASVGSGLSTSPGMLTGFRALLGLGAAFLMPVSMSLLTIVFPAEERARAMGLWITANSLGVPVGPLLGGWMLDHFHWGWVFFINVPVVLVALVAVAILVPRTRGSRAVRIDLPGIVLSSAALVLLTYGFIRAGQAGWGSSGPWILITAGIAVMAGFVWQQARTGSGLVDLSLFRSRTFTWSTVLLTVTAFGMMGLMFVLPQYFQSVRGASAFESGLRLLPVILGLAVGARVGDRLVTRLGGRVVAPVGLGLIIVAGALGAQTTAASSWWFVHSWETLAGVGMGLALPVLVALGTSELPESRTGTGSAVLQTARQAGGTLGVAILGSVLAAGYRSGLEVGALPGSLVRVARDSVQGAIAVADAVHLPALADSAKAAFVSGMSLTLVVTSLVLVLPVVAGFAFLPGRRALASLEPVTTTREGDGDSATGSDGIPGVAATMPE